MQRSISSTKTTTIGTIIMMRVRDGLLLLTAKNQKWACIFEFLTYSSNNNGDVYASDPKVRYIYIYWYLLVKEERLVVRMAPVMGAVVSAWHRKEKAHTSSHSWD